MKIPKRSKDGFYAVQGRQLISVTTALGIIDTGVGDWKARVGTKESGKISRESTTIGKQVHKIPEADVKGVEPKLPKKISPSLANCMKAYERWKDERNEKLLLAEEFCYSLRQGYAGTADAVGVDAVYDFKTSKKISPLYWLQLAAYAGAIEEMDETKHIRRLVIVRLDKDSGDYYQEEREFSTDILWTFWAALRVWRYYNITEKEIDDDGNQSEGDSDERIIASRELEPNRSGNSEEGSDKVLERSEDSHDRAGEIWQV